MPWAPILPAAERTTGTTMGYNLRRIGALIQDVRTLAAQRNWRAAWQYAWQMLVTAPYRRIEFIVFARSLDQPIPEVQPLVPVTIRLATLEDIPRFEKIVLPSAVRRFVNRIAHNRLCFVALHHTDIVAYCWATPEVRPDVDNISLDLEPHDIYFDDAYTVPAYRRRKLQTAVHLYRMRYVKQMGFRRAVLIVDIHNHASLALVQKLGYREIGKVTFVRILGKRWYLWSPAPEETTLLPKADPATGKRTPV